VEYAKRKQQRQENDMKNNKKLKLRKTENRFGLREIRNTDTACFCVTIDSGEPNGMPDFLLYCWPITLKLHAAEYF
jgi:hypothetical protein